VAGSDSQGGTQAGYQQPQTTIEPPGGPFIRHSQQGRRSMYAVTGVSFGGLITQPMPAATGYVRGYRLVISVTGGTGSAAALTADAPFNIISQITLKDAFGTPLIVADGYSALYLLPKFAGGFGTILTRDVTNLPSYQAPALTGNLKFTTQIPLEFAKGYGVISGANASLPPNIQFNLNTLTTVYSNSPGGTPVVNVVNDADFYWLPEGVSVEPPGLGTTRQWVLQPCTPGIGSGSSTIVQLPRLGGYIDTLILILRDINNNRVDAWPALGNRLRIILDGVQVIDSAIEHIYDDMAIMYQGTSRPTGVIAFSRKNSLSQEDMGLFDTLESTISTNPGTQIEIQGVPWGTVANPPATLYALIGQIVPAGTLVQGLPES